MLSAEFTTMCTAWLSEENPSLEAFAKIIAASLKVLWSSPRFLAQKFEVAESTVLRWANGVAHPHPLIQKQVVQHLLDLRAVLASFED